MIRRLRRLACHCEAQAGRLRGIRDRRIIDMIWRLTTGKLRPSLTISIFIQIMLLRHHLLLIAGIPGGARQVVKKVFSKAF